MQELLLRRFRYLSGGSRAKEWHDFEVKFIPTLALFTLLVLGVLLGYHLDNTPAHGQAKPTPVTTVAKKIDTPPPVPVAEPYPALVSNMNAAIAASPSLSASATLIDLATGREYDAGHYTQAYEAASTAKLVAIFDYIHQVELGKATLTQSIEGQQAQDVIMRMIVYSDNDAWDKLNHYLRFGGEQSYLDSIGVAGKMTPSNIQFSTPAMAKLLRLLYQGKLMNADHQALIYDYMAHTTMNKLIPAVLPADTTVYHKYGQIDGVLHDASIIEYQGRAFVLVVYTDGGQYSAQTSLIHAVTTAAFSNVTKS